MTDVLARIAKRKRQEATRRAAPSPTPPATHRSLRSALQRSGARFIMEVKRRSPSGHVARHSLERAVAAYAPVADAISVLVDGEDFGGSLDDLRAVRKRFDGPILAKDFVVDRGQVLDARAAGADAILVMLSILDDREAEHIMAEARTLNMDCLVEVHDERELERAIALEAEIVGINNRNLKTLDVDLAVTERLAPMVPPHILLVSESGIGGFGDVARLADHVDAFLVGSSLMASDDIAMSARSLVFGPVKICGLTRVEDVALAARLGATHAGFIFHPASPRKIDVEKARTLVGVATNAGLRSVGIFDGGDPDIVAVARSLGLDSVQVHGAFDPGLKTKLGAIELIVARSVRDRTIEAAPAECDRIVYDRGDGGTGQSFDWSLLQSERALDQAFLAGGLGPHNAAAARRTGVYGIDLSSGLELEPGVKDPRKMAALFDVLRPTSRSAS